jgi:hypothetical protein
MKKPKLDSRQAGRWLQDLTDTEFIAFFYSELGSRNIYRAEGRYRESHLVLGVSSRDREDNGTAGSWRLQVLAPTPGQNWGADAPVCQFGTCTTCGHATASIGKSAQCPVCMEPVRGG